MIKEFREFFIRTTKVFTGDKADQELNYPTTNMVDTCEGKETKYNRLLSQHYASDSVIKKFLESITFKLNPEDTSKLDEQGLSKIASDEEAASNYIDVSDFSKVLQSHQLPIIMNSSNVIYTNKYYDLSLGTIHNNLADAIASGNKFVKAFIVDGGSGGPTLLLGEAYNPAKSISNNPTVPQLEGIVTIDKALHLLQAGDLITYYLVYEFICNDENETVAMQVVLFDGTTEVPIHTNNSHGSQPITEIPIRIQRTDAGDLFISTGNWSQLSYIAMPTTNTFQIYTKFTATSVAGTTEIKYYALTSESKTQ